MTRRNVLFLAVSWFIFLLSPGILIFWTLCVLMCDYCFSFDISNISSSRAKKETLNFYLGVLSFKIEAKSIWGKFDSENKDQRT